MPDAKKSKKPEKEGGHAVKEAEVGGRSLIAYDCWNCGAVNWVPSSWAYFVCWRCGSVCWT
jgi:hypothetical protein